MLSEINHLNLYCIILYYVLFGLACYVLHTHIYIYMYIHVCVIIGSLVHVFIPLLIHLFTCVYAHVYMLYMCILNAVFNSF